MVMRGSLIRAYKSRRKAEYIQKATLQPVATHSQRNKKIGRYCIMKRLLIRKYFIVFVALFLCVSASALGENADAVRDEKMREIAALWLNEDPLPAGLHIVQIHTQEGKTVRNLYGLSLEEGSEGELYRNFRVQFLSESAYAANLPGIEIDRAAFRAQQAELSGDALLFAETEYCLRATFPHLQLDKSPHHLRFTQLISDESGSVVHSLYTFPCGTGSPLDGCVVLFDYYPTMGICALNIVIEIAK